MADESTTAQQERTDEQRQSGISKEPARAGQGVARSTREGMQSVGRAVRQGLTETGRATREHMDAAGEQAQHITEEIAADTERLGSEIAGDTSELLEEWTRLAVLPEVATRGLETVQETANSVVRNAMETNLRLVREMSRVTNPAFFLRIQQRIVQQAVHGFVEHGTEMVRATQKLAQETLEPFEKNQAGRAWQGGSGSPVGNVMSREVRIARPDQTVEEAARLMEEADTGALPVGENDRLIGMVTDRDIALRVVAKGKNPRDTRVRDAMTEGIRYCFDDEPTHQVAKKMSEQQIRRLPVLNRDKRLVGIISLGDISTRHSAERAGHALRGVSEAA